MFTVRIGHFLIVYPLLAFLFTVHEIWFYIAFVLTGIVLLRFSYVFYKNFNQKEFTNNEKQVYIKLFTQAFGYNLILSGLALVGGIALFWYAYYWCLAFWVVFYASSHYILYQFTRLAQQEKYWEVQE